MIKYMRTRLTRSLNTALALAHTKQYEGITFSILPFYNLDGPELSDATGRPGLTHATGCGCCSEQLRTPAEEVDPAEELHDDPIQPETLDVDNDERPRKRPRLLLTTADLVRWGKEAAPVTRLLQERKQIQAQIKYLSHQSTGTSEELTRAIKKRKEKNEELTSVLQVLQFN